jgi:hypothetical protein
LALLYVFIFIFSFILHLLLFLEILLQLFFDRYRLYVIVNYLFIGCHVTLSSLIPLILLRLHNLALEVFLFSYLIYRLIVFLTFNFAFNFLDFRGLLFLLTYLLWFVTVFYDILLFYWLFLLLFSQLADLSFRHLFILLIGRLFLINCILLLSRQLLL